MLAVILSMKRYLVVIATVLLTTCSDNRRNVEVNSHQNSDSPIQDTIGSAKTNFSLYNPIQDELALVDSVSKTILLGYQMTYDTLPNLVWEVIDETIFLKYKIKFQNRLNVDSTRIVSTDTTFSIRTSKAILSFSKKEDYNKRGACWTNYKGFFNTLKLYVFENWCSGEILSGDISIIDSLTNIRYEIIGRSDGPFEPPVLSPNSRFLITYGEDGTYFDSFVGVIEITKDNDIYSLKEFASSYPSGRIVDLGWITNDSFVLKLKHQTYNSKSRKYDDSFSYLKASLPNIKKD
jgi:hypothetical protein